MIGTGCNAHRWLEARRERDEALEDLRGQA
jgi:hypothetical protein